MLHQNELLPEQKADVIIMERSPVSDQIFMRALASDNQVDELELNLYNDWCQLWRLLLPFEISLFVYVKTDIGECMSRIQKRLREGETGISKEYQINLLKEHDLEFDRTYTKDRTRCLVVDGSPDYRIDEMRRVELIQQILDEISS